MSTRSVVFLNSHPIQYFAPLYQQMAKDPDIDLEVIYCSDETLKGATDKQFGVQVMWDIPLLQGYTYRFLKNRSFRPSIFKGFWGLMNTGIIPYLFRKKRSVVIVHGWGYFTHVLTLIVAKLAGHRVCLRAETPLNQELEKAKLVTRLKHLYLRFLFLFVDRFLYIGTQNKLFYRHLGIKERRLVFTPYSVDNARFSAIAASVTKEKARELTSLPAGKKLFLFSGKYIGKKRPLDLLQAFRDLQEENALLVMVGDGELRPAMEQFIQDNGLAGKVVLTGFVNQSQIPHYYAAADFFVMCSGLGETWGLSVNEAMNFGLPVVISDTCGSARDLVEENKNGHIYVTGDTVQLSNYMRQLLAMDETAYQTMADYSRQLISRYDYPAIIRNIKTIGAA
ncbi:MAG: glycosyltransferase family 4 protein [Chitinophagaceae bacterium]